MSDETVAEVEAEAAEDNVKTFEFDGETYKMRRKFKRLKFLRLINSDPMGALELAFPDQELDRLEELDLDEDQLQAVMEAIGNSLTGGQGNSGPSQK